jgi:hypothetical protein
MNEGLIALEAYTLLADAYGARIDPRAHDAAGRWRTLARRRAGPPQQAACHEGDPQGSNPKVGRVLSAPVRAFSCRRTRRSLLALDAGAAACEARPEDCGGLTEWPVPGRLRACEAIAPAGDGRASCHRCPLWAGSRPQGPDRLASRHTFPPQGEAPPEGSDDEPVIAETPPRGWP